MLVVDSYEKLNALLKLLHAVKFDMPPEESLQFSSSPYINEIYRDAYQAAIELLRRENKEGEARRIESELFEPLSDINAFEVKAVEKHIEFMKSDLNSGWREWTLEEKREFVKLLFSPFAASTDIVEEIIKTHS